MGTRLALSTHRFEVAEHRRRGGLGAASHSTAGRRICSPPHRVGEGRCEIRGYTPKFFDAHQYKTLQSSMRDDSSRRRRFGRRDRSRRSGVHRPADQRE